MWNKIAGNSAPPQGRAPVMAQDDEEEEGQEMAGGAPGEEMDEGGSEDQGGMQAGAAAGQPGAQQIPPEMAQHVDQNNPLQMELVKRTLALTPQDAKTFFEGITAPAIQVLKKLVPELGFIFDRAVAASQAGQQGGAAPGAAPGAPGVPPAPPAVPQATPGAPQQTKSRLFGV